MGDVGDFRRWRLTRRDFLAGTAGLAATSGLASRSSYAAEELNILVWCDHADSKLLAPFEAAHNVKINVKTYE